MIRCAFLLVALFSASNAFAEGESPLDPKMPLHQDNEYNPATPTFEPPKPDERYGNNPALNNLIAPQEVTAPSLKAQEEEKMRKDYEKSIEGKSAPDSKNVNKKTGAANSNNQSTKQISKRPDARSLKPAEPTTNTRVVGGATATDTSNAAEAPATGKTGGVATKNGKSNKTTDPALPGSRKRQVGSASQESARIGEAETEEESTEKTPAEVDKSTARKARPTGRSTARILPKAITNPKGGNSRDASDTERPQRPRNNKAQEEVEDLFNELNE